MSSRPQRPQRRSERCVHFAQHPFWNHRRQQLDCRGAVPHRRPFVIKRHEGLKQKALGDTEPLGEEDRPKLDAFIHRPGQRCERPLIKVRFGVFYRCHSRQLLCMGGSQFPFGWSFVSIAKLPMTWNPGDHWSTELHLPQGLRLEYKYVILEEQVSPCRRDSYWRYRWMERQGWTNQQNDESEGIVEVTYRSGTVPGQPPDTHKIRKQMAIVDWQPGPNRVIQIPDQEENKGLIAGKRIRRMPARPRSYFSFRKLDSHPRRNVIDTTWEELYLDDADGQPVLHRHDIWPNRGVSLSFDDARRFFLGE